MNNHILLTFTYGVSLRRWNELYLLSREILIYKKLIEKGFQVTLLTYGNSSDFDFLDELEGINIIPVYTLIKRPSNTLFRMIQSFFIPFMLKKRLRSITHIKTNQMNGAWVAIILKYVISRKLIVRCGYELLWNSWRESKGIFDKYIICLIYYLLEFFAFSCADKISLTNFGDKEFIQKRYPVNKKKISIIRNFLSMPKKRNINFNDKKFVYLGRIDKRKNLEMLIEYFSHSSLLLDIYGYGEKKYVNSLKKTSSENICFKGGVDNKHVIEILTSYSYFLMASFFENNPKALMEAMAAGVICIASNTFGVKELIRDGETGFLFNLDSESLDECIKKVIALSHEELIKVSQASQRFAKENFSIESVLTKEIELYN